MDKHDDLQKLCLASRENLSLHTRMRLAVRFEEVLELIAENKRLKSDLRESEDLVEHLQDKRAELKRENEILRIACGTSDEGVAQAKALCKEAARYRWLRNKQTFIWLIQDWFPGKAEFTDVDAEIDAAMSKEAGQ
jgi:hypothetical protein